MSDLRGEAGQIRFAGITFVPSPSANLVGVAKKLLQKKRLQVANFVCASRSAFSTKQAEIRSSQGRNTRGAIRGYYVRGSNAFSDSPHSTDHR